MRQTGRPGLLPPGLPAATSWGVSPGGGPAPLCLFLLLGRLAPPSPPHPACSSSGKEGPQQAGRGSLQRPGVGAGGAET